MNAVLFLRPAEIVPAVEGWPIYEALIVLALAAALPTLTEELRGGALIESPATVCVLALMGAVMLSHLSHMFLWGLRASSIEFAKIIAYFLLLMTVIDSPQRLRSFLRWTGRFTLVLTVLALLHHFGALHLNVFEDAVERQEDLVDPSTGQAIVLVRLAGGGLFGNPNDLARILVVGIIIAAYMLTDRDGGPLRIVWALAIGIFGYALALTYSRGGFLALLASVGAFCLARFGWRRSMIVAPLGLLVLFVMFAGRQTDLSIDAGTAQSRVELWRDGLSLLRTSPLFGIGMDQYDEYVHHVAHNSFVHCFVELGLFGGTIFAAAFYIVLSGLYRARRELATVGDPVLRRMYPYITAILVGYVVGMLSSSRSYVVPTYMLLGFGAVWLRMAGRTWRIPMPMLSLSLMKRAVVASAALFLATYVYVRLNPHG